MKKIGIKRINLLFKKAFETLEENEGLARRYVFLAWMIKNKIRVRIPKKFKNKFCKRCFIPWVVGKTLSIRLRRGRVVYRCKKCGFIKRFIYKK